MTTLHDAARMAIDAISDLKGYRDDIDEAIAALREALEAPEPEPVARCILDNGDEMGSVEWLVRPRSIRLDHGSLLYAAPPVAPAPVVREPLTDEQLAKIAVEDEFLLYCDQESFNEIARAIEAAHGIGGGNG